MNKSLSTFLNLSRWFAAFLVVLCHVRHLVLTEYGDATNKSVFLSGFYFLSNLGHESVVVFFVLSGYLVGALTWQKWSEGTPNLQSYAIARFSRIYTVLVPALLLGYLLDYVGFQFFNQSELYTNSAKYNTISLYESITSSLNLHTLAGNLLLLQTILVSTLGSNGPLWSLANEWWYYVIFALLARGLVKQDTVGILSAISALVLAFLLPGSLLLWGTIWAVGLLAHRWINSSRWRPAPLLASVIFVLTLVFVRMTHKAAIIPIEDPVYAQFIRDLILSFAYLTLFVSMSRMNKEIPGEKLHLFLSEFSYSTYLLHFPGLIFLTALSYQALAVPFRRQPDLMGLSQLLCIIVLLYAYCYLAFLLFERNTGAVRDKLHKLTKRQPNPGLVLERKI